MSDGPLYLIAVIKPRMELADVVVERLRFMRDATREEPGNIFMELVVGEDADTWLMLEKFASREAWDEHMTPLLHRALTARRRVMSGAHA